MALRSSTRVLRRAGSDGKLIERPLGSLDSVSELNNRSRKEKGEPLNENRRSSPAAKNKRPCPSRSPPRRSPVISPATSGDERGEEEDLNDEGPRRRKRAIRNKSPPTSPRTRSQQSKGKERDEPEESNEEAGITNVESEGISLCLPIRHKRRR